MLKQKPIVFVALLVFANAMHCAKTTKKQKTGWRTTVFCIGAVGLIGLLAHLYTTHHAHDTSSNALKIFRAQLKSQDDKLQKLQEKLAAIRGMK